MLSGTRTYALQLSTCQTTARPKVRVRICCMRTGKTRNATSASTSARLRVDVTKSPLIRGYAWRMEAHRRRRERQRHVGRSRDHTHSSNLPRTISSSKFKRISIEPREHSLPTVHQHGTPMPSSQDPRNVQLTSSAATTPSSAAIPYPALEHVCPIPYSCGLSWRFVRMSCGEVK